MKVGVISDIHGNLPALEAVLNDMPSVDSLICTGDIVGYNPWPAECVERIRGEADVVVSGNHDLALLNGYEKYRDNEMAYGGLQLADEKLSDSQKSWMVDLPELTTAIDERVLVVHSHPDPDIRWTRDGYVYPKHFTDMARHIGDHDALVFGHTHVQHSVDLSDYSSHGLVVNPGSVGQPRDKDPRAAYAIIDPLSGDCSEHRTEYDIETVKNEIEACGLPRDTAKRLEIGE